MWVANVIQGSREDADWNGKVLDGYEWRLISAVDLVVLSLAVVVEGVASRVHHLGIVHESPVALSTWLIVHEHGGALEVVDLAVEEG